MLLQQEIAFNFGDSLVGYELDVLIEEQLEGEPGASPPGVFTGRAYCDAPEIDGVVYVTGENLQPGQMVPVQITERRDYDLVGEAVGVEAIGADTSTLATSLPVIHRD